MAKSLVSSSALSSSPINSTSFNSIGGCSKVVQNTANNNNNPSGVRKRFTPDEDAMLLTLIGHYGQDWMQIAAEMGTRSIRQCRERWRFFLSPDVDNNEWTTEENNLLLEKYGEIGPKWKRIQVFFPKRTYINIRNHFRNLENAEKRKGIHFSTHNATKDSSPIQLNFISTTPIQQQQTMQITQTSSPQKNSQQNSLSQPQSCHLSSSQRQQQQQIIYSSQQSQQPQQPQQPQTSEPLQQVSQHCRVVSQQQLQHITQNQTQQFNFSQNAITSSSPNMTISLNSSPIGVGIVNNTSSLTAAAVIGDISNNNYNYNMDLTLQGQFSGQIQTVSQKNKIVFPHIWDLYPVVPSATSLQSASNHQGIPSLCPMNAAVL